MRKRILVVFIVILAIHNLPINALTFSARRIYSRFAEGNEETILQGNAIVENDEIRIESDTIQLSGEENRYISAEGSVFILSKDDNIQLNATTFSYDSEEDIYILEGNTRFVDEEEDIVVTSAFMERQPNFVVFQINVQLMRDNTFANAEYVRYFENEKRLELSGFPIVYYKDDRYSASTITIFTETDEIILDGEVRGQVSE